MRRGFARPAPVIGVIAVQTAGSVRAAALAQTTGEADKALVFALLAALGPDDRVVTDAELDAMRDATLEREVARNRRKRIAWAETRDRRDLAGIVARVAARRADEERRDREQLARYNALPRRAVQAPVGESVDEGGEPGEEPEVESVRLSDLTVPQRRLVLTLIEAAAAAAK